MTITYSNSKKIDADEAIDLYIRSTLGERRPVHNRSTFKDMFENSNLIITAWDENKLVGVARTLTDFSFVAYLSDLAVDQAYQRQGIGKRLIEETKSCLGKECMIVLLAAPKASEYYGPLGFEFNPRAWIFRKS